MTRPRPGTHSSAMTEKCTSEKGKLRQMVKTHLQQDMCRLLEQGSQGDVTLDTGSSTLRLHKCVLKHRGPAILSSVLSSMCDSHLTLSTVDPSVVQQALRSIYSEDSVDLTWCDSVFAGISSNRPMTSSLDHPDVSRDTASHTAQLTNACDTDRSITDYQSHLASNLEETFMKIVVEEETHEKLVHRGDVTDGSRACTLCGPTVNISNTCSNHLDGGSLEQTHLVGGTDNNNAGDESVSSCCHSKGSGLEGATEPCCQLGEDLLQMYVSGTDTDICLKLTTGETFHAHRCMLSLRSSYFAAMFDGNWKESTATEVTLHGVSPSALHIGLQFMYGGVCVLPPGCDLSRLLLVADLYEIDHLKDVVVFKLKMDKCHFFHKPCSVCAVGVAEVLGLTSSFHLVDLRDRAVRWCTRYFPRVWSSQVFASLPDHVQQHCLQAVTKQITNDTIIDTIIDCDTLMGSLSTVKWSLPVVSMATDVMDACVEHLRMNFTNVLETRRFQSMATTMAMGLELLETVLSRAVLSLPTHRACATYAAVHRMKTRTQEEDCSYTQDFCRLVVTLCGKCENYMISHVNQLIDTVEWKSLLSAELQTKIRNDACYVCISHTKSSKGPPKLSSSQPSRSTHHSGAGKTCQRKTVSRRSQTNIRKSQAVSSPGTSQAVSSPGTPQAVSSPGTSQAVSSPGTPQAVSSPGTPQAVSSPDTPQAVSSPGIPQAVSSPGTPQAVSSPGTPQAVSSPGTPQAVSSPGIPQAVSSPGTPQAVSSPGTSQAASSPDTPQAVRSPGTPQAVSSPGTSQAVSGPGTSQAVSNHDMPQAIIDYNMSQATTNHNMSHAVSNHDTSQAVSNHVISQAVNVCEDCVGACGLTGSESSRDDSPCTEGQPGRGSIVFTESTLIPFIHITYRPAQRL